DSHPLGALLDSSSAAQQALAWEEEMQFSVTLAERQRSLCVGRTTGCPSFWNHLNWT
ncbi:hypothetical protein ILYODFUR_022410, partial [Ilyodon furcidens]